MNDRSSEVRRVINNMLIETGEKERLKEKLKNRLTESGWKDDMKVSSYSLIDVRCTMNLPLCSPANYSKSIQYYYFMHK
jgi:hypothetical protein